MNGQLRNGHGGTHAVDAAVASGATHLFTLSGAHVFQLYDAAVGGKHSVLAAEDRRTAERERPLRLIDVRHEQTAGPGVTNGISAITPESS